ncbi:MAG: amino acid deaminase/aldolase [Bacteroidetes bacterium]|nr:amino acid deaminase/aldolase [Bacteroidota bacterium]
MLTRNFTYYNNIFKDLSLPLAFCDVDLLNQNCQDIAKRVTVKNKTIRVASKSIRCIDVLRRIFNANPIYKGILSYSGNEALFLSENDFDDILLGYPIVNKNEIEQICKATKSGKKIILMVDSEEHLKLIQAIALSIGVVQPICIDIDMSTSFPGLLFGVMRSPLNSVNKAKQFIDAFDKYPNISLKGVMGYEAQIAGLGDKNPANGIKNYLIPYLKKLSIKDFSNRRKEIVDYIKSKNHVLDFVNAGGTGSIESSMQEDWVTEITVGSGFYSPALFDYYSNFHHQPAAGFAVQIVRKPNENTYTCLGGGYIASGTIGIDKQPKPYLPQDIQLTENEGTGEVQTPCVYYGKEQLSIGDTILFRHSKAGELCERFNQLHLISDGKNIGTTPTYRGQGKCFL